MAHFYVQVVAFRITPQFALVMMSMKGQWKYACLQVICDGTLFSMWEPWGPNDSGAPADDRTMWKALYDNFKTFCRGDFLELLLYPNDYDMETGVTIYQRLGTEPCLWHLYQFPSGDKEKPMTFKLCHR